MFLKIRTLKRREFIKDSTLRAKGLRALKVRGVRKL